MQYSAAEYEELHFNQRQLSAQNYSNIEDYTENTPGLKTDMNVAYGTNGKRNIMTMTECSAYQLS